MDKYTRISKLFVFYFVATITLVTFSSCKPDFENSQREVQMKNENCNSIKLELLLRNLLKKSFLYPRFTGVNENDSTISYYLRLRNFTVPKKNFYVNLTPSDSNSIDSIKLILTDSNITKGRQVAIDIFEKNDDTTKVKILVNFGVDNIASGVGLYRYEYIKDSCTWNMMDSAFSWEY